MTRDEIVSACLNHTLYSWSATGKVDPLPVDRAEGIYLWDVDGKRYIDWNSGLMSVNIGHSHPKVLAAVTEQMAKLAFAYPGAATEVRAKLALRLAELVPGNLNTFFFTLGGAEANENAIRAARLYSGRQKILSRYRSYHGGTNLTLQATGDNRRWYNEPGAPGFVRVMDPWPYDYSFGDDEDTITRNHLRYLEETIRAEGPHTIAAMIIETVTGTNGILMPPRGWLAGLRALLDKYGILLICDEVMCGWGRTGKLFAFEHGGIVPDILTMAKGLTSSYLPLGAVAVSDPIATHFRSNVFWGGLTYNAHPTSMACALAAVEVLVGEGMVENAARMEPVMRAHMERLRVKHPSVRRGRCFGLFGLLEIQDRAGNPIAHYPDSHPAMAQVNRFLLDHGLVTVIRWDGIMCNPPLCITEAQIDEGFAIIDQALAITDAAMG